MRPVSIGVEVQWNTDGDTPSIDAPAKKNVDPMVDTRYFKEWEKLYLSNGVLH